VAGRGVKKKMKDFSQSQLLRSFILKNFRFVLDASPGHAILP
jgi:hypothetical protein